MKNLEDADYYSEEQAEQIRSIALKGYWGTVGYQTDQDGNTILDDAGNPVPKVGSLEALKATLLASGEFTAEELESLTDGVALTATQMAIWSCSNKLDGIQFVNTHYVGAPGDTETDKGGAGALGNVPQVKEEEAKLMFKLYEFLRGLEPTTYEEEKTTANTVINHQNFLKDMSLTVLDKAEGHVNNQDTDTTNDAYVTNLSFALVVTPSTENGDDLVVSVVDKNGNVIASGRIAGEALEIAAARETEPTETVPATTETEPAPTEIHWVPAEIPETDANLEQLRQIDLEALREVNPDVMGWILIPETKINYPFLQGEDNEFYLQHTWQKNRNYVGSIFLECGNQPDFTDFNTIIYGHNLKNGTMFAAVRNYMSQKYYEAHPYVYLVTDQGLFRYEIFSAHMAPVDSMTYGMAMKQENTRQEFLDYITGESVIETPVIPAVTDQIITLSTCSGRGYAKRWVIHARLEMLPVVS